MTGILEKEFSKICHGINEDREAIIKHNPLGTNEEILLWMLLSVLHSYLSLTEEETPRFPGKPSAEVYRDAIGFVLKGRKTPDFDEGVYIEKMTAEI